MLFFRYDTKTTNVKGKKVKEKKISRAELSDRDKTKWKDPAIQKNNQENERNERPKYETTENICKACTLLGYNNDMPKLHKAFIQLSIL